MRDKLFEQPQLDEIALCSGNASDVDELLDLISERYTRDQVQIWTIGPVIGAHGGPGVIGFAWHHPKG